MGPHLLPVDRCRPISPLSDGRIAAIGTNKTVLAAYPESRFDQVVDATGRVLLPGLVDAHTHPVWSGDRVDEFAMKVIARNVVVSKVMIFNVECSR